MSSVVARVEVLSLLRQFLRNANKFANYNFREHAKRRALAGFRINRALVGDAARAEFLKGKEQLEVVRRQAIVSSLYPQGASVTQSFGK